MLYSRITMSYRSLKPLFSPQSIAIVGATESQDKPGYAILFNLLSSGFGGTIYPVNPGKETILGLPCYKSLDAIDGKIDLAVIVIPGKMVLETLEMCGKLGVESAVVISAGFRETGHEGLIAEQAIARLAQRYQMPILGPNCLGLIDTFTPMNVTFAKDTPPQGKIGFMSQSGALCTSILDIAIADNVGFSYFVSLGNKADLNEIDFLQAWVNLPEVRVVLAYLEGITDGAKFIETARQFTKTTPIVAIKAGVTTSGSRAVSSHTGALAGSERAYEAAFKQAGVIRANSMGELFDFAIALAHQPLPRNDTVVVVTNAGGPGIMATDAIERAGLRLASLGEETLADLKEALPAAASVLNPIDLLGDAGTSRYKSALEIVLKDPNVGSLIVILTPQFATPIEEAAQAVADVTRDTQIPVLCCFMGKASMQNALNILTKNHIPNYVMPERAIDALAVMTKQRLWQEELAPPYESVDLNTQRVTQVFERVRREGRVKIGDAEAREILEAYRIPVPASKLCATTDEAVAFAEQIGYPVVLKIASPDILHKTDIGGVRINVRSATEVRDSFDLVTFRATRYMPDAEIWGCLVQQQVHGGREVIVGMNRDPQFGPLVMFGLGGIYVEALKDVTFRIAPFSRRDAMDMIREMRSFNLLRGVRGETRSDLQAIVDTLLKVSQLVVDFPDIVEMDINPLMVFEEGKGVMGIDMRLVLA
ncbi:MAG TPA: acetate--CoA ligase family protein [Syntrophorhabdaceae bacterium]|nr:acetate--CoA ligase family protein [Syntrophorhabdaceae bacterium]